MRIKHHYLLCFFLCVLFLCTTSLSALAIEDAVDSFTGVAIEQKKELPSRPLEESAVYATTSELVIVLKTEISHLSIYDITGKEVFHMSNCAPGIHTIEKNNLPPSPAMLLVRMTDHQGETKIFKIRL